MYVFVRSTGYALLFLGLLLILLGLGGAVYCYLQNDSVVALVNTYILANSGSVLLQHDIRPYTTAYGLALFLLGMITAAFGQLLMVFVDIAVNTRETNALLRRKDL